jgi:hypothetical protein
MTGINGLMGPRMSTNMTVERQTPNRSFGARVQAGVNNAAGAVAGGVGMATGLMPGGGIVSAAVSSMSALSSGVTGNATTGAPYAALPGAGGGGGVGVPSVNTTVGGPSTVGIPGVGGGGGGGGSIGGTQPNYLGGNTGNVGTEFNGELASMFTQQKELLKMQASMQHESQRFTAISNVMKNRHDTLKNSIGNIR